MPATLLPDDSSSHAPPADAAHATAVRAQADRPVERRAARRGGAAARARADPGRRRLRQDARADHAHRLAAGTPRSVAGRHPRGHVHEQGRQGDADAARRAAADQPARHVDRHVSRAVQSLPARALQGREPAAELSDPRHAGPVERGEEAVQAVRRGRRTLSAEAAAVVHQRREGRRPASGRGGGDRCRFAQEDRAVSTLRGPVPARRRGRFCRAAAAQLRAAARQRADPRALPAALSAHPDRRVSGHQQAAVRVDQDAGRLGRGRAPAVR